MQQGGSPYGAPPPPQQQQQPQQPAAELTPFRHAGLAAPEAAPPISARPPAPNYEELGAADDPLGGPGDEGIGGGISGNRWPRQETLALLKIRSDMDAAFRDATLKGPLWEEVSRKLAELGYRRSAKKCKEKFENVHKYYKRTKEGRAGRQDGKSYRFFTQLEALHNITVGSSPAAGTPQPMMTTPPIPQQQPSTAVVSTGMYSQQNTSGNPSPMRVQPPMQISAPTPIATAPPAVPPPPPPQPMMAHDHPAPSAVAAAAAAAGGISFSSNTDSSSASEGDDDDDEEATEEGPSSGGSGKKRKREQGGSSGGGVGGSRKMMAFFEGLMRQVMERQEAMQQRFLEAIEKREQDRMIREEAWRRQEMSRLSREHELAAQDRAASAARDSAIISFLQKVTGQTLHLPPAAATAATTTPIPATVAQTPPPPPPPPAVSQQPIHHQQPQQTPQTPIQQHHHQQQQQQNMEVIRQHHQTPPTAAAPTSTELVPMPSSEPQEGMVVSMSMDPASSRWPKSEVHALIKLRSELDSRYQESGPKGPLWEEISAGMQRLGYNRSSKRCKEKWENINKYFKKVKESNKKRPEDAKTCPYFHQLDALYRSKQFANSGGGGSASAQRQPELQHETPNPNPSPISMVLPPPQPPAQQQQQQHQGEAESKNGGNAGTGGATGPINGGIPSSFFGEGTSTGVGGVGGDINSGIMKKPEDIVKELMGNNNDYSKLDDAADSDNMEDDDEDDEEDDDDEDGKGQYRIQFQRPNVGSNTNPTSGSAAPNNTTAAGGKASGSFLAMVR